MVAWSGLLRSTGQILLRGTRILPKNAPQNGTLQIRVMSDHHRLFPMTPTRWQWHKTKDMVHLYVMAAVIPFFAVSILVHIFVGPAELTPIPEGYLPKHWEYYKDPTARFIARYLWNNPQMEYEKYCHFMWAEGEIMKLRQLQEKVDNLMYKRKDYQAYYYQPYKADYVRVLHKTEHDRREIERGEY